MTDYKKNEIYALTLWAIRRIPSKRSRIFAYNQFLEATEGKGEHSKIAKEELDYLKEESK